MIIDILSRMMPSQIIGKLFYRNNYKIVKINQYDRGIIKIVVGFLCSQLLEIQHFLFQQYDRGIVELSKILQQITRK